MEFNKGEDRLGESAVSGYFSSDDEFCEMCQLAIGEVMNKGTLVCRRCDKELKRQNRKIENAQHRREERNEDR